MESKPTPRTALVMGLSLVAVFGVGSNLFGQPLERSAKAPQARLNLGGEVSGVLLGDVKSPRTRETVTAAAAGVAVTLFDANDEAIQKTKTDRSGKFRFSFVRKGDYKVCWTDRAWGKGCQDKVTVGTQAISLKEIALDARQFRIDDIVSRIPGIFEGILVDRCDVNGENRFLTKRRNSDDGDPGHEEAIGLAYYEAIDPFDERLTMGEWWRKNGFDPVTGRAPAESNGFDAGHVSYLNDNDLGFGRDMHCIKKTTHIACWVANHGKADQDPGNADLAAAQESPVATVTMEWRVSPQAHRRISPALAEFLGLANAHLDTVIGGKLKRLSRVVTFYAYAPDASGTQAHADYGRIVAADLDGCGDKYIPGLCLNCHGGTIPVDIAGSAGSNTGWNTTELLEVGAASFREFDHPTYKYPGGRDTVNVTEEAMFYALNQLVLDTQPEVGIEEVINGWYANGTTLDPDYFPDPGWAGASDLYIDVVGRYCRTCHVAFEDFQNWNTEAEMQGRALNYYLCDEKSMPHAAVTFFNMSDTERNDLLAHFGEPLCN